MSVHVHGQYSRLHPFLTALGYILTLQIVRRSMDGHLTLLPQANIRYLTTTLISFHLGLKFEGLLLPKCPEC